MRLIQITRYPVKSLQGESVDATQIDPTGMRADRAWGIRDEHTGRILTARRAPALLYGSAALGPDGEPTIRLPDAVTCHGRSAETDAALSDWLGHRVRLVAAGGDAGHRAEYFADATDDASEAIEWTMPAGRFVDASPLLVLTTASLRTAANLYPNGDWDVRRFRANLLVDVDGQEWVEDDWYEARLQIGSATLCPTEPCVRCTMVTRPQPGLHEDRDIFRALARHHRAHFGAWTAVASGATIRVGDEVRVSVGAGRPDSNQR